MNSKPYAALDVSVLFVFELSNIVMLRERSERKMMA